MHAFTVALDLSNSWNFKDSARIKTAGNREFDSRIVAVTNGGTIITCFPL
jgi:hypothetical protein